MKNRRFLLSVFLCCCGLFVASCASVNVKPDVSAVEISRLGQNAMDLDKNKQAIQYFEILRDRMSDANYQNYEVNKDLPEGRRQNFLCEALYEIAFLHYKLKSYGQAEKDFAVLISMYSKNGSETLQDLINRYGSKPGETLPRKFLVLTNIVLEKIKQKTSLKSSAQEES